MKVFLITMWCSAVLHQATNNVQGSLLQDIDTSMLLTTEINTAMLVAVAPINNDSHVNRTAVGNILMLVSLPTDIDTVMLVSLPTDINSHVSVTANRH